MRPENTGRMCATMPNQITTLPLIHFRLRRSQYRFQWQLHRQPSTFRAIECDTTSRYVDVGCSAPIERVPDRLLTREFGNVHAHILVYLKGPFPTILRGNQAPAIGLLVIGEGLLLVTRFVSLRSGSNQI